MQTRFTTKIVAAQVAWRVSLVAIAAVVFALWSSIIDGQSDLRMSRADEPLEAVVDAQGTLHVPSSYRADYGPSPPTKESGPASFTMSMRARGRSPGIAQATASPMELCWSKRSMRPRRLR